MSFYKTLNSWYLINKRDLPWRQTRAPYYVWLSEIILQQTQVKQGLPYYLAFVKAFPSVFDLANAKESDVLKLWQGLGYYSRARHLHATAKYVADVLKGAFPDNYRDLRQLKGVGDYTASAIASICFNEPTAVVDGNVYRVLSRYFGIAIPINTSEGNKVFKALAQNLIDKKDPAAFNQAIMDFGTLQCRPKNPYCSTCPFAKKCVALSENKMGFLPVKRKPAKAKKRHFNFLVLLANDGKTILEKREEKGIWQRLYQFPLIETDKDQGIMSFRRLAKAHALLKGKSFKIALYNEQAIVHKLSHQHLHTKFWIVKLDASLKQGIPTAMVKRFAVPILLGNFIDDFKWP